MKWNKSVLLLVGAALSLGVGVRAHSDDAAPLVSVDTAPSFREKFNRAMDDLDVVFERTRSLKGRQLVAEAKQRLLSVSDEEIAETFARGGVPDLGPLVSAAGKLAGVADRSGTRPRDLVTPSSAGFPDAPGILGACGGVVHDPGFTFGALIALQVARAIIAAAEFACEQIAVVAGFGANTSAVCIPIAIAADAAAIPFELASFCAGEEDSALLQGSYDRLAHLHGDVDAARLELLNNANANRTDIINNDNSNTTTILNHTSANTTQIINNDNSNTTNILNTIGANADLAEARQIEDNLARDSCTAWMYTPEYADPARTIRLGGRFEKVVGVIQAAIDNARALQTVKRFELECAQDSLDHAVAKAGRRPPLRAEKVCDLLLDAYEKVTPSCNDHGHGHSHKDHDKDHDQDHHRRSREGASLSRSPGVSAVR
jgi:hypothetical protein